MFTKCRGIDPTAPTIQLFADEVKDLSDYAYYKKLSAHVGKPLEIIPRPEPKPANALTVKRDDMRDVRN